MQLFGAALVLHFITDVFSERSPVGAKRNWESHFDAVLINDHSASPACNLIDIIGFLLLTPKSNLTMVG